eukprot:g22591.t1
MFARFPEGPGSFKLVMPEDLQKRRTQIYTMDEVSEHCTAGDLWLVYDDMVFDVTKFATSHPGGWRLLERFAGKDATDEIRQMHPDWVLEQKLPFFYKGRVSDPPPVNEVQAAFRDMFEDLNRSGMFKATPGFYMKNMGVLLALWFTIFALVLGTSSNALHLVAALLLAAFWQQAAFIGHDIGHNSVFIRRDHEMNMGLFWGNFCTGISIGWWKCSHNVHHCVPNSLHDDPDIQHVPVLAIHPGFFNSIWSTYHTRTLTFDWLAKIFIPYQHYLYYPIMAVARFNLYVQSIMFILFEPHIELRMEELVCYSGFFVWIFILLCNLNSWSMVALFLFFSVCVSGILEVQITLSHFSQPVFTPADPLYGGDFYTRQVISSMDVYCPEWMDWFHGGLEKQTIHHLFPRVPRANLRAIRERTIALCEKVGLEFTEETFLECNRLVIKTLREAAEVSKTWSPLIAQGFNAVG